MFAQVQALLKKEIVIEWRQRYAFNGIVLYITSAIFITYLSFGLVTDKLSGIVWNTLFWIILLFAAINAVAKSFVQESTGRRLYYYSIAQPEAIIVSKIIYSILLMILIAFLGLGGFSLVLGNPVADIGLFLLNLLLGTTGFAMVLTVVSSIAAKAHNSATLMSVLGLPIITPLLLLVLKVSKNALDGLDWEVSCDAILAIGAIDTIVMAVSYILFPFLWRS